MLWQWSLLLCQSKAHSIMPCVEQLGHQHVTTISLRPRGQVSNVCSLRVSHSLLSRRRTCHSRAPTQTTSAKDSIKSQRFSDTRTVTSTTGLTQWKWHFWWVSIRNATEWQEKQPGRSSETCKVSLLLFKLIFLTLSPLNWSDAGC